MKDKWRMFAVAVFTLLLAATPVLAQAGDVPAAGFDWQTDLIGPLVLSVVFTIAGLMLFAICLVLVVKVAPFSVRKEIEEDQNTALGIIIGSMILGIAIILAAALLG